MQNRREKKVRKIIESSDVSHLAARGGENDAIGEWFISFCRSSIIVLPFEEVLRKTSSRRPSPLFFTPLRGKNIQRRRGRNKICLAINQSFHERLYPVGSKAVCLPHSYRLWADGEYCGHHCFIPQRPPSRTKNCCMPSTAASTV